MPIAAYLPTVQRLVLTCLQRKGLRAAREKYIPQIGVLGFKNGAGEIVSGIGKTVGYASLLHLGVSWNPDHPTRPRRRSSDKLRLLNQENAQTLSSSHRGSRHSTGPRANDDYIISVGNRHCAQVRTVEKTEVKQSCSHR